MAFDNTTTITGNMVRPPELSFIGASGIALTKFSIADNQRKADGETEPHFFDCVAWRELAEHIAESFETGQRVIVHGKLVQNKWTDDATGQNRSKVEIHCETAGHCLKFYTSIATKEGSSQPGQAPKLPSKPAPEVEPF
jgi:single-strand DNA-binding protein